MQIKSETPNLWPADQAFHPRDKSSIAVCPLKTLLVCTTAASLYIVLKFWAAIFWKISMAENRKMKRPTCYAQIGRSTHFG
jgi:hypothetical protein